MITSQMVKQNHGRVDLNELRWSQDADYDTVSQFASTLKHEGQKTPITVDRYGNVLKGSPWCEAAWRMGWGKIKVEVQE